MSAPKEKEKEKPAQAPDSPALEAPRRLDSRTGSLPSSASQKNLAKNFAAPQAAPKSTGRPPVAPKGGSPPKSTASRQQLLGRGGSSSLPDLSLKPAGGEGSSSGLNLKGALNFEGMSVSQKKTLIMDVEKMVVQVFEGQKDPSTLFEWQFLCDLKVLLTMQEFVAEQPRSDEGGLIGFSHSDKCSTYRDIIALALEDLIAKNTVRTRDETSGQLHAKPGMLIRFPPSHGETINGAKELLQQLFNTSELSDLNVAKFEVFPGHTLEENLFSGGGGGSSTSVPRRDSGSSVGSMSAYPGGGLSSSGLVQSSSTTALGSASTSGPLGGGCTEDCKYVRVSSRRRTPIFPGNSAELALRQMLLALLRARVDVENSVSGLPSALQHIAECVRRAESMLEDSTKRVREKRKEKERKKQTGSAEDALKGAAVNLTAEPEKEAKA